MEASVGPTGSSVEPPAAAARVIPRRGVNGARLLRQLGGIAIFFLVAEIVTRMELVPPAYLPRASTIAARFFELLYNPPFLVDVGATLAAWALGLAFASLLGIALGILIGSSELTYRMISPLIEFFRPIPSVAIIPLGIILWGQGFRMKVILVAYAALWPILYNTIYGVHDVDPIAIQTGRSFNLRRWHILRRIVLPSAAPLAFTGIRISASLGLIVVVGAELLASADTGIGSFILFASSNGGQMDIVLGAAAVAGAVGVAINHLLALADRRLFGWRHLGVESQ
jgi:NitT/TauT family transport system permease protein